MIIATNALTALRCDGIFITKELGTIGRSGLLILLLLAKVLAEPRKESHPQMMQVKDKEAFWIGRHFARIDE